MSSSAPSKVMAKAAYTLNGENRMLSWLPDTRYVNIEVPQDDVARESGVVWLSLTPTNIDNTTSSAHAWLETSVTLASLSHFHIFIYFFP